MDLSISFAWVSLPRCRLNDVRSSREGEGRQCSSPSSLQVSEMILASILFFDVAYLIWWFRWMAFENIVLILLAPHLLFATGLSARKSCEVMHRRLLLVMIIRGRWLCLRILLGSILTEFSLSIRYSFWKCWYFALIVFNLQSIRKENSAVECIFFHIFLNISCLVLFKGAFLWFSM